MRCPGQVLGRGRVKVDFMDSDTQARFGFTTTSLAATAAQHLMINFHGATVPRGSSAPGRT